MSREAELAAIVVTLEYQLAAAAEWISLHTLAFGEKTGNIYKINISQEVGYTAEQRFISFWDRLYYSTHPATDKSLVRLQPSFSGGLHLVLHPDVWHNHRDPLSFLLLDLTV